MYEGHWFGGGFMWIFWLAVILFVIWIVKMTISGASGVGKVNNPEDKRKTALEILQERYARGEIEQKEFDQKKKDLL